jgi:hypothetical protein
MLDLPGTSLDMTSHTNGISQARLLNFNILKGIYMGNMKEAEANVWMATLAFPCFESRGVEIFKCSRPGYSCKIARWTLNTNQSINIPFSAQSAFVILGDRCLTNSYFPCQPRWKADNI